MPDVNSTWPSQHRVGSRPAPERRNARRSRERLLSAAGELLARGDPFTLRDVAGEAGVSVATAYRHFGSAEEAGDAFIAGFLDDVAVRVARADVTGTAAQRLGTLNAIWVRTVLDWGWPLAHLRSPRGFLARRKEGEEDVVRSLVDVEPVLRELAGPDDLAYAIAVWNALADPRELLDQRSTLGWEAERIADRLQVTVLAVIGTTA